MMKTSFLNLLLGFCAAFLILGVGAVPIVGAVPVNLELNVVDELELAAVAPLTDIGAVAAPVDLMLDLPVDRSRLIKVNAMSVDGVYQAVAASGLWSSGLFDNSPLDIAMVPMETGSVVGCGVDRSLNCLEKSWIASVSIPDRMNTGIVRSPVRIVENSIVGRMETGVSGNIGIVETGIVGIVEAGIVGIMEIGIVGRVETGIVGRVDVDVLERERVNADIGGLVDDVLEVGDAPLWQDLRRVNDSVLGVEGLIYGVVPVTVS